MSSSNLVQLRYKEETTLGETPLDTAATAILNLTADITLTAVPKGAQRNTTTFTIQVIAPAANPTNTVLATFSGTAAAIVVTITPNDGTNNGAVAVPLTTAELRELITTGAVVGKVITLSDTSELRELQTATGGGATALADGGEGDGVSATYANGAGTGYGSIRYTSENFSGTPETTESQQIRTDRMSSGQVVTGLTVEGGFDFELAKEQAIEDFLESAMFSTWVSFSPINSSFSVNATTHTISRLTGSFTDDGYEIGDFVKLSSFADTGNNVIVMIMSVSASDIVVAHPSTLTTAAFEAAVLQKCDKLDIGITKKPFSIEKRFLDLTEKGIIYRGALVSQFSLNVEYGQIVTGTFGTMAADYEPVEDEDDFISPPEYITPPATTNSMNGSVDMPFQATDVSGSWAQDSFCLQSLNLSMDNNFTVQNCIGRAAPQDFSPGTAAISVSMSSYLRDGNWDLLARKLSQESFALGFLVQNVDGWYGFYLPAIQVSFDDPQSGGANQEISMDMAGVAKIGDDGESALSIWREPAA